MESRGSHESQGNEKPVGSMVRSCGAIPLTIIGTIMYTSLYYFNNVDFIDYVDFNHLTVTHHCNNYTSKTNKKHTRFCIKKSHFKIENFQKKSDHQVDNIFENILRSV